MSRPRRHTLLKAAVGAIVLAVGLAILPAASASADTVTEANGVTYDTISGSTVSADAYSGTLDTVVIPSSVTIGTTPFTVVAIGTGAFDPLGSNSGTLLMSVTLPSTLVTLGTNAFARNQLTSIDIPNGVTDIGGAAFFDNKLTAVDFPSDVTTIEGSAFFGNQLTSLSLPSTVTSVGSGSFSNNPITSLTLDNALVTIGGASFQSENFTTVTIPASVTSLGDYAFNTPGVTSATFLGPMPTTIGAHIFGDTISGSLVIYYDVSDGDPPLASGYTTPTWQANVNDTGSAGPFSTEPFAVVQFIADGGSSPADSRVLVGDSVSDPGTSRAGYIFNGWFTSASAGTQWKFTDPVTGDLTLFAHWSRLAVTGIDPMPTVPVGVGLLVLGLALWFVARRRLRSARG